MAFLLMQSTQNCDDDLELAPLYAKMGMMSCPSKSVQTWLDTVHAGESSEHMVLDGDAPAP